MLDEVADRALLFEQEIEDAPAIRLGDDVEEGEVERGRHDSNITRQLYSWQGLIRLAFGFLARLGATRGGSPGIFGYTGGHGASVMPLAMSRS